MCVYSNLRIPRNSCWMCCFTFCTYDIKYQKSEGLLDDKSVYESTVFQNAMEKNESFCTSASLLLDLFFFRLNCHLHSQLFPFSEIKLVWQRLKFTLKIKKSIFREIGVNFLKVVFLFCQLLHCLTSASLGPICHWEWPLGSGFSWCISECITAPS